MSKPRVLKSEINNIVIPNIGFHEFLLEKIGRNSKEPFMIEYESQKKYSYGQFLYDILKLGASLKRMKLEPADAFIIYGHNCYEALVCLLAGLTVGGIGLAIREMDSPYDAENQIREREAKFIFVSKAHIGTAIILKNKIKGQKEYFIYGTEDHNDKLKTVRELINSEKEQLKIEQIFKPKNSKETVAMYIMGSGSTGPSKACMVTHYGLVAPNVIGMAKLKRLSMSTPLAHISGIYQFTTAVVNGALLITLDDMDPEKLISAIQKHELESVYTGVANIVYLAKREPPANCPTLRIIVSSGSILYPPILEEFYNKYKSKKILTLYTMTEVGTLVATTSGDRELFGSLGKIAPMIEVKVVDSVTGEMLGPNKTGEILVKGPAMFKGYHKDPEATKASLDKDGFMRTGDIGFYKENEVLYLVDRKKDFIEQGQWRFPPADIETVLLTHEAVKDAAVAGISVNHNEQRAYAFVILKDEYKGTVTEEEMKNWVNSLLSNTNQVEGQVLFVDSFPRTNSTKVLRRKLAESFSSLLKGV